jgi:ABC-type branched-subunit amino acid transport system substrate-binding protein
MRTSTSRITRNSFRLGIVLAAGTLAAACGSSAANSSGSGTAASSGGVVQVGAEASLTGTAAVFGAQALAGVETGIYAVNQDGGLWNGSKLHIDVADDASDPVDAVPPAHKLVDVDHVAFQDGEAGATSQAVYQIYAAAHIPYMMPGGDTYYDHNTNPYVWRLSPSDSQLGVAMALWAHHLGYTRAAGLFIENDVAEALGPVITNEFKKLGGTMTSDQAVQPDLPSYSSEISKLLAGHPQVIFSEADPPTESVFFKDLQAAGVNNLPTIGTDDMVATSMLKAIGIPEAMKLMTNVEAGTYNSPAVSIFNTLTQEATHKPVQAGAYNTYDGVVIAALAEDAAHAITGPEVNAEIPKVTEPGGELVYSYAQGKAALAAGKRITYIGASGPFYFNKYHNVFGPFVVVKATSSGNYQTIYTISASALKAATG